MHYFLITLLSLSLIACGSPNEKPTLSEVIEKQRQELVDYFKSDNEPTIKDAMFDTYRQLKISVINDGTNRDGLATYVCEIINERFDSNGYMVTVYDAEKIMQNEWKRLGQVKCN